MIKWTDLAIYKILCAQRLYDALNGYNSVRPIPVKRKLAFNLEHTLPMVKIQEAANWSEYFNFVATVIW